MQPEYRRLLEYCWRENFLQGLPEALVAEFMSLEGEYERLVFADLEEAMALGLVPQGSLQALGQALRGVVLGAVHVLWSGCFDRMGGQPTAAADYVDRVVPFAIAGLRFQHVAFDSTEPTTSNISASEVRR